MIKPEIPPTSTTIATPNILKGPFAFLEKPIRRLAHSILRPMFQSGSKMIEYNHLDESISELDSLLHGKTLLAVITSHTSHSDVLASIDLIREIRSRYPQIGNFYIPVAASLVRGNQGFIAQLFYSEGTVPLLEETNTKPLSVVTENDKKKRHLVASLSEIRQINHAATEPNSAFVNFAEGSVEGGRRDILGNRKGLQKVTNGFLPYVFQKAHEAGKKVIVLSVGISGTEDMISPYTIFITRHSAWGFIQDWIFKKPPSILARINLGHPYEYSPNPDGKPLTETAQKVNDEVMTDIAKLKPVNERGYYDPSTKEYQQAVKEFENRLGEKLIGKIYLQLFKYHIISPPATLKQLAEKTQV